MRLDANASMARWYRRPLAAGAALLLAALMGGTPVAQETPPPSHQAALVIDIDGAIGPAIGDYVSEQLAEIDPATTGLVILRMDTPGGLDTAMRKIIRAELASPVPVVTYVAPTDAA